MDPWRIIGWIVLGVFGLLVLLVGASLVQRFLLMG
jgi:hypothetical protein